MENIITIISFYLRKISFNMERNVYCEMFIGNFIHIPYAWKSGHEINQDFFNFHNFLKSKKNKNNLLT